MQHFTDTLGDWVKFHEFLELADKIRHLATACFYILDPVAFGLGWIASGRQRVPPRMLPSRP
jgi:hypothetical protein